MPGTYISPTETGLYYVSSRYYDAEIGRFVNSDAVDILDVQSDLYDKNLYAYCDNNPMIRTDVNGDYWVVAVGVGLATQYVGDVISNIANGATGVDIFRVSSTAGEYIAAGVTALIPGSGLTGSLIRNVAAEVIVSVERNIKGQTNSLAKSVSRIALGTVIDTGIEKVSNTITKSISTQTSKTYSQYAKTARQKNPTASTNTIRQSAQRSVRWGTRLTNCINFITNALRSALPW